MHFIPSQMISNMNIVLKYSKQLFKNHVIDYWQTKFRNDVIPMKSLLYFKPEYMSLSLILYGLHVVQTPMRSAKLLYRPECYLEDTDPISY